MFFRTFASILKKKTSLLKCFIKDKNKDMRELFLLSCVLGQFHVFRYTLCQNCVFTYTVY